MKTHLELVAKHLPQPAARVPLLRHQVRATRGWQSVVALSAVDCKLRWHWVYTFLQIDTRTGMHNVLRESAWISLWALMQGDGQTQAGEARGSSLVQLGEAGHVGLARCPQHLADLGQLVRLVLALQGCGPTCRSNHHASQLVMQAHVRVEKGSSGGCGRNLAPTFVEHLCRGGRRRSETWQQG